VSAAVREKRAIRLLAVAEAAFGVACLAWPGTFETAAGIRINRVDGHRFVQILGVRHLVQAGLIAVRPTRVGLGLGAGVDAVHATTMIAVAALDRTQRTPALRNAAAASAWWLLEVAVATHRPRT
jgi:hypothetical protein